MAGIILRAARAALGMAIVVSFWAGLRLEFAAMRMARWQKFLTNRIGPAGRDRG